MALTNTRSRANDAQPVVPDAENFMGDEVLAVPVTAGGLALAAVPANARHVYLANIGAADVYARPTSGALGGNPTTANGFKVPVGGGFDYTGDPSLLKLISSAGTVNVYAMYFGEHS